MSIPRPGVRRRLVLLCTAAVATAVAGASTLAWWVTADTLAGQVDRSLEVPRGNAPAGIATVLEVPDELCRALDDPPRVPPTLVDAQLVRADGTLCGGTGLGTLTPTAEEVRAAAGGAGIDVLRSAVTASGTPVRVRSVSVEGVGTVMIMRDVTDVESALRQLAAALVAATIGGSLVALLAGWLVARAGLRPLDSLTAAAEHIAATEDLDVPIDVRGRDEIARLAAAFNRMTAALSRSRARQRQLVADVGHELRTPLTSLRTNVELLARADAVGRPLPAEALRDLRASVVDQTEELARLVRELTVLAHDEPSPDPVPVDLVAVIGRAVQRAARRGDHRIVTDLTPWWVRGDPASLERAVVNILDNAVKFAPAGSPVDVSLRAGVLIVDDAGPGIPPDQRHRVFDRFWRSPAARSRPGSGLGLSIVADAVARHGGEVDVLDAPLGGTRVRVRLPGGPTQEGTTTTSPSATPASTSARPSTTSP
ncbi:MAG: sensor histidine kinase [Kineosporiaceae bacterium]